MSKQTVLQRMGLTQEDFDSMVASFNNFYNNLNPNQQLFFRKNLHGKTAIQVAQSVGGDATAADVQALFAAVPAAGGSYFLSCC